MYWESSSYEGKSSSCDLAKLVEAVISHWSRARYRNLWRGDLTSERKDASFCFISLTYPNTPVANEYSLMISHWKWIWVYPQKYSTVQYSENMSHFCYLYLESRLSSCEASCYGHPVSERVLISWLFVKQQQTKSQSHFILQSISQKQTIVSSACFNSALFLAGALGPESWSTWLPSMWLWCGRSYWQPVSTVCLGLHCRVTCTICKFML